MGWVDLPGYFSGASKIVRDIVAEYAEAPIGSTIWKIKLSHPRTRPEK